MRYTIPLLLLLSLSPLAAAQTVSVQAAPWAPDGGPVPIAPGDFGRTPLPEQPARPGMAQSHLHPGDAQRRQDQRLLTDELAAQQSADSAAAQTTLNFQRENLNQQFSNEIQGDHQQRDISALQMQLSQPQPIFPPPARFMSRH